MMKKWHYDMMNILRSSLNFVTIGRFTGGGRSFFVRLSWDDYDPFQRIFSV